ncbi:MAG: metalloregulator ArsR/SmtB family transcription factor [Gemmatimonadetes bacterium]|nr:metalloregulator ArsR/SmtB family transcription factor [Gemmatimonadota bacterium]NNF37739.1 winged helix-turn-helix transcriptional regulator [Gemmatimonadota bacterium]
MSRPDSIDLPDPLVQNTARMLRCLGHPVRLRVIDLLERRGEATVSEIHESLDLEQAVCSQHLGLMRDKGILERRKDGVHVFYRLGDPRALKVLSCLRGSAGEG